MAEPLFSRDLFSGAMLVFRGVNLQTKGRLLGDSMGFTFQIQSVAAYPKVQLNRQNNHEVVEKVMNQ